jgi:hypothetical protein
MYACNKKVQRFGFNAAANVCHEWLCLIRSEDYAIAGALAKVNMHEGENSLCK